MTHVADTGLLLSGTNVIQFNDASQNIGAPSNAILDINATDEIELNATLVDVNANLDVSGTLAVTGIATFTDDIIIGDGKTIGSASDVDAITIPANGIVEFSAGFASGNFTFSGQELDISANDFTIDVAGDLILDADGGDIFFKDAGTTFGSATNTSGNLILKSGTTTAATFSGANVTLAGTVGSGAITSTGIVTGTGFTAGSAVLAEAELELLDGLTAGTAIASKVVTTDANIDTTGQRNLTISGELDAATGDFSGAVDVAGAFTSSTGATITTADNTNTLSLVSTDADGSTGPNLLLYRNSSSPAS